VDAIDLGTCALVGFVLLLVLNFWVIRFYVGKYFIHAHMHSRTHKSSVKFHVYWLNNQAILPCSSGDLNSNL
jgi:hypothetical protein